MSDVLQKEELELMYKKYKRTIESLMIQVENFFKYSDALNDGYFPTIHSIKSRVKDLEHLIDKIHRKQADGRIITKENLFSEITDIVGVRVLYLYQDQFRAIHDEILSNINEAKEWVLVEDFKAYTWDPESKSYYESLGIKTILKASLYTSVHYVIKKNNVENPICCEIQVRTLFEEIWGEIDHTLNYPHQTDSVSCKEQLKVLSKLVATGTRLSDSIFRTFNEFEKYKH